MTANAPSSDLERYFHTEMCRDAAVGVELQYSGEYWDDKKEFSRHTQIHVLPAEERKQLPTCNLNCEIYLAKFGLQPKSLPKGQTYI